MLLGGAASIAAIAAIFYYIPEAFHGFMPIVGALIVFIGAFLSILLVWAICCFTYTRFINMNKEYNTQSRVNRFFVDCVLCTVMQYLRIKMHVTGEEIIPEENYLFVCNHRGAMDPLVTMRVLSKYNMAFVAKKELFKMPVISRLMHRCFCLSLNRGDVKDSAKTILRAGQIIKDDLASMGIYPEGTRSKEEEMLPFMHGAFKVAKKAECPILVATIKNTEHIMKNAPLKRTHVYLDYIGVIDKETVVTNNTVQLSNMAREMMERHLQETE